MVFSFKPSRVGKFDAIRDPRPCRARKNGEGATSRANIPFHDRQAQAGIAAVEHLQAEIRHLMGEHLEELSRRSADRLSTLAAIRELAETAAGRGLLLLIDDLDAVDPTPEELAFLIDLAELQATSPVRVVLTASNAFALGANRLFGGGAAGLRRRVIGGFASRLEPARDRTPRQGVILAFSCVAAAPATPGSGGSFTAPLGAKSNWAG